MTDEPRRDTLDVAVVPHTHWDREWYQPAGVFRQRLVALVDELLADAPSVAAGSFLLDGQAVVLDDYLAVRPERRAVLAEALGSGALEAGPWYVLADELIPSGEALVRNLLAGRRTLAALGATPPPVLYSPDAFGHTAAMPALADGFGFPLAIIWRGYGGARWPAGDAVWWTSPSGARVLAFHLPPDGYEFGSSLPIEADAARDRWQRMRDVLAPRSALGIVLVQNGADHHARQHHAADAIATLRDVARPDRVEHTSLRAFALAAVERAARVPLETISGELRDSYGYTWTLQGTFASRAAQKRRNATIERLLVCDVEPWLALGTVRRRADERPALAAAWRTLLLNHPHDTLCGCSTDEVARAANARYEDAAAQGRALRRTAIETLVGHDGDHARGQRDAWRPQVIVRNAAARRRGGVAELELVRFVRDVPAGPGSGGPPPPREKLGPPTVANGAIPLQFLSRTFRHDRIEAPRHYPDNDLVDVTTAVAWVPEVDGFGLRAHALGRDASEAPLGPQVPVVVRGGTIDNGIYAMSVDDDGGVSIALADGSAQVETLIAFEDVGDAGDLYTHSPIGRRRMTTRAEPALVHAGPLRGEIALAYRWRLPARAQHEEGADPFARPTRRSRSTATLPLEVRLIVDAGAPFVRVHVRGENRSRDHRLRIVFRTGVRNAGARADAAFGPVARAPLAVPPRDAAAERPPSTAPLHRWVSIDDGRDAATIIGDGLAEYEALPNGDVAITLVRAVAELSRNDLPERLGHAGWPVPTPEAQSLGMFEARFAVAFHAADDIAYIERLADDVLLPLTGHTLRSAVDVETDAGGLTLEGEGLAFSAAKPSEDGEGVVLRCVNVTAAPVAGAWRLRGAIGRACIARLDETLGEPLEVMEAGGESIVSMTVPPHGVHSVFMQRA